MSDLTNVFTDIADAIRAKTQTQITYKPTEMASAINNIETGGGAVEITKGQLNSSFNSPVIIPNGITNIFGCFSGFTNFNQPVTIPDSVIGMGSCFSSCYNFNQPVNIPNGVVYASFCFAGCYNFNQSVNIPNSITNMQSFFKDCNKFNQPVTISNSATTISACFQQCKNFNQPVNIPSRVTNMAFCFQNCHNFNQPVNIPNSVVHIGRCFHDCTAFASIIRVACNPSLNVFGLLQNTAQSKVRTIITDNTSKFLVTNTQSIVGASIIWTQDGDNYYNTAYNIYINYSADPFNEPDPVF